MNFLLAVAYHICLALPAAFTTQPGDHLLAEPCTSYVVTQYSGNVLLADHFANKLCLILTVEFDWVPVDDALFGVGVLDRRVVVGHEVALQNY